MSTEAMKATDDREGLIAALRQILGPEKLLLDAADRAFFSQDLSMTKGEIAAAVIRPVSTDELAKAVQAATARGYAVVPRGGGMSYTRGYMPEREKSILVDMRQMNRILEINAEDMYVTVETGCTWSDLYEALKEKGLRTPYFGPLSGKYATVGGALSQNSLFLGSGIYHTVAESVLGLRVVLADGSVLQTGSGAHKHSNPFYRHFGPDMTGIFTADTGAFGIKAVATLRLIPFPAATTYMSFSFETLDAMLKAQSAIARLNVATECYGFDPYYNAGFEKQGFTFKEGITILSKVAAKGLKGIGKAIKMAAAGQRVLRGVPYSLHMTFDGITETAAYEGLEAARALCLREGGMEIENGIPTVFRAQPFGGVRTVLLGSEGELWIPVHGFFPLSRAVDAGRATEAFFRERADILKKWDIRTSYLTCFSGAEFVIEPSFYWHDELGPFRLSLIEEEFAAKWKDIPADTAKREVVLKLREELRDLFDSLGACHLQLGKYYRFEDMISNPPLWKLLNDIKTDLDPDRLINPGSLGMR